jgi:hypothetical protein
MEEENRIKMDESKDPKDMVQQLAQQVSSTGDAATQSSSSGDEPSVPEKVQAAMTQGQESGLLNSEQLQDGSIQDKVKEAVEKGQAPGGFLTSASASFSTNPLTP